LSMVVQLMNGKEKLNWLGPNILRRDNIQWFFFDMEDN